MYLADWKGNGAWKMAKYALSNLTVPNPVMVPNSAVVWAMIVEIKSSDISGVTLKEVELVVISINLS